MSILIKGMEMPTGCLSCGFCNPFVDEPYCRRLMRRTPKVSRLDGCPLIEIPDKDVQPVKWIPVSERLPEEYKNVLCYYEYFRYGDFNCMFRTIDRGYYGNGIWGGEAGQGHKNKVLAWMPLPEPPKEERA